MLKTLRGKRRLVPSLRTSSRVSAPQFMLARHAATSLQKTAATVITTEVPKQMLINYVINFICHSAARIYPNDRTEVSRLVPSRNFVKGEPMDFHRSSTRFDVSGDIIMRNSHNIVRTFVVHGYGQSREPAAVFSVLKMSSGLRVG